MFKSIKKLAVPAVLATIGSSAFAAGTAPSAGDLSALVPDMSTILTAVASVGVALIGLVLAQKGFHVIKDNIKRG